MVQACRAFATLPAVKGKTGHESRIRWLVLRLRRHGRWAQQQGLRRLIEEDSLNPLDRGRLAFQKWAWRRSHPAIRSAAPVFLVGVQRSGTNMIVRGLERAPEFEVRNESDRHAFDRFQLRPDGVIRQLIERSGHRYVLFKPLCDSHRVGRLLETLATPSGAYAIWAYREFEGRVRSSLAKFGDDNLRVLREIAAGQGERRWQAQGLSEENRRLIASFDYDALTPASAAALFWYIRNSLYFEQGLDQRADVMLISYDRFVADPAATMQPLCDFLGFAYSPQLVAHVESRAPADRAPLELDERIRAHCTELLVKLDLRAAQRM
jgi:hypothetical protein